MFIFNIKTSAKANMPNILHMLLAFLFKPFKRQLYKKIYFPFTRYLMIVHCASKKQFYLYTVFPE